MSGKVNFQLGDARDLHFANNTIDRITVSPPYSIAFDYMAKDMHALKEVGFDLPKLKESIIGVRGVGASRLQLYYQDFVISMKEIYRALNQINTLLLLLAMLSI